MGEPIRPAAPLDVLLYREVDRLDRRIDSVRSDLQNLDQHGSRGVDGVRSDLRALTADVEELAGKLTYHEQAHVTSRRWTLGMVAALITPLYPLLFAALLHR